MKTLFLSIGVTFLSLSSVFSTAPPKIEKASPAEGVFVTYGFGVGHNTVIELKGGKFRYWFSSDRKGADVEGLEGTYTAEADKIVMKHPKLIPLVSNWTVRSIDGVVTLWRSDALKSMEDGKLDLYRMGKENFFRTGGGSILVPSKKTAEEAWKAQQIAVLTEAEHKALPELQERKEAEQGGTLTANGLEAHAENESFPTLGISYQVTWPENARRGVAQIKVIRKGEGTWILVEYTQLLMQRVPPRQPGHPDSDKPQPPPKMEKGPTKEMWVNTQWLMDATVLEDEKK